jgi:hypothetical protein
MIQLPHAVESSALIIIIPLIIDTADPKGAFTFPDDMWYLQSLLELYAHNAAIYKAHNVTLHKLADAIQALRMKLAVKFTENESARTQKASIINQDDSG